MKTREDRLLESEVLGRLVRYLPIDDLNNFRIANYLNSIRVRIPINDADHQIYSFDRLDDRTYRWIKNVNRNGSKGCLKTMVQNNNFPAVEYLFHLGCKVHVEINEYGWVKKNPFYWAIRTASVDMIQFLIDKDREVGSGQICSNLDCRYENGYIPLHVTILANRFDAFKCLVQNGANFNMNHTLAHAAQMGRLNICKYIVNNGCNLDPCAFRDAIDMGHIELVKYLTPLFSDKLTSIIYSTQTHLNPEIFKYFISIGFDVNSRYQNRTLLIKACNYGTLDAVKFLVESGADLNVRDHNGHTPLMLSIYQNKLDIFKYLIDRGADIDTEAKDGKTALDWAITLNEISCRLDFIQILRELEK